MTYVVFLVVDTCPLFSVESLFQRTYPLKSPICIPGCYGNGRLHQNNNMVRTTSPRRLRKLERKRQRAHENPRTHNGPPNRSLTQIQVILEVQSVLPTWTAPSSELRHSILGGGQTSALDIDRKLGGGRGSPPATAIST